MSDVTDADRERAAELRSEWMTFRAGDGHLSIGMKEESDHIDAIAAALAEERAKARAPFRDLAQELATVATDHHATVAGDAYADAADRIIAVLEGTYL